MNEMGLTELRAGEHYLSAVVSGSFHRHIGAITTAVQELSARSIRVLSPADPRVVAHQGEFLFLASDRVRSVRLVQDRHLESIRSADFLWLVCPDGYVGQSTSMEVGFAAAARVPILATHPPNDLTLREYVTRVPNISEALRILEARPRRRHAEGILIDPHATVEQAHNILQRVEVVLTCRKDSREAADFARRSLADLQTKLRLPTCMQ